MPSGTRNDVLALISEGLHHEYADPIEENAREDGEWVIEPRDTSDVLAGIDTITENMNVFDEIVRAFSDSFFGSISPCGRRRKGMNSGTAGKTFTASQSRPPPSRPR
jgi:hypothetical protein